MFSSILTNRQLVMLSVARPRVTRSTVDRERRGGRPTVRNTSREGGSKDTHTIEEGREASLSHRVRYKGLEAARARGAAGAAGLELDWQQQLIGGGLAAAAHHGVPRRRYHWCLLATTSPGVSRRRSQPRRGRRRRPRRRRPRTAAAPAALGDNNKVTHARAVAVVSCVAIGIAAGCTSGPVCFCCCYPERARVAFESPDHLRTPRGGENPPPPSSTTRVWRTPPAETFMGLLTALKECSEFHCPAWSTW